MKNTSEFITFLNNKNKDIQKALRDITLISKKDVNDEVIKMSLDSIGQSMEKSTQKVAEQIEELRANMDWEEYNIAFFGETNAGKSTIIEALTQGEGKSIGDGRADYTKESSLIKYDKINLIDLPGMEGDEKRYLEEIKNGLQKAHLVIYVTNHKKAPEETTLLKIKEFLKDQTNIYAVINVKRPINNITYKNGLINEDTKLVINETNKMFKKTFGEHFIKTMAINAKVGFLCRASSNESKLLQDKEKAVTVAGNINNVYKYSNFESLNHLIKKINFDDNKFNNIMISNSYKQLSIIEEITSLLLRSKKDLDLQLKKIDKEIKDMQRNVEEQMNHYQFTIKKIVDNELSTLKAVINEIISLSVKEKWAREKVENKLNEATKKTTKEIEKEIIYRSKIFSSRIENIFKNMNEQINFGMKFNVFEDGYFDIKDIMKKASINFKYFFKSIGGTIITAISLGVINPIMAIVGAVVTLFNGLFKWFTVESEKTKKDHISKLQLKQNENFKNISRRIDSQLDKEFDNIKNLLKKEEERTIGYFNMINSISRDINYNINKLINTKSEISSELLKNIEKINVEFAYFDYKLRYLFYIGENIHYKNKYNLSVIEQYNSIEDCLNQNKGRLSNKYYYFKSNEEAQKRAFSSLFTKYRRIYFKEVKGVRKVDGI